MRFTRRCGRSSSKTHRGTELVHVTASDLSEEPLEDTGAWDDRGGRVTAARHLCLKGGGLNDGHGVSGCMCFCRNVHIET